MYSRLKICLLLSVLASCVSEDIGRKGFCDGSLTLAVTFITQPGSCSSEGSISVYASGNYLPFKFSHNGGTSKSVGMFSVLPGIHSITVTDANECSVTINDIVVNSPPNSTLSLDVAAIADDNSCLNDNGSVTLIGSGGTGLTYSFNGSSFTAQTTYSNLTPGVYDSQVKDGAGCISSKSVEIKRAVTGTSWVSDVKPLLAAKCVSCHPGSGTSDDWGKYSSVFQKRSTIKTRVTAGTMPPGGSPQLTANEKALINCWIDDGAPEN